MEQEDLETLIFRDLEQELIDAQIYPKILEYCRESSVFASLSDFFKFNDLTKNDELNPTIFEKHFKKFRSIYRIWIKGNVFFIFETGNLNLKLMMETSKLVETKGHYAVVSFFISLQGTVLVKTATKQITYLKHCQDKVLILLNHHVRHYKEEVTLVKISQRIVDYHIQTLKDDMQDFRESIGKLNLKCGLFHYPSESTDGSLAQDGDQQK